MVGFIRIGKEYLQKFAVGISPSEETIAPQSVGAGASATLKDTGTTAIPFAIVVFQGDGDAQVRYDITIGNTTYSLYASEIGLLVIVNSTLKIVAVNEDTIARKTGTIVISRVA